MANKFFVAASPHIHSPQSTQSLMRDVLIALVPAFSLSLLIYGLDVLRVTAIAVVSCVLVEYLIQRFLFKGANTVKNLSAVLTGVLLAFNLPSDIPWWIIVIGAVVAIGVAKMTFGGLGRNPFNPALVGRVFLLIAYPVQMTSFPKPISPEYVDAFAGATPLAAVKAQAVEVGDVNLLAMLQGVMPGSFGEIGALALLCGGLYMLWRKVITWHIPVAVLGSMAVFAFIVALTQGGGALMYELPAFHLLAGGAMLGAIFMATDYVTSPMTAKGMLIYGVGIGVITMIIRQWGAYPEGMSFAILLMNSVTPLINKYVKPKRFGIMTTK
ncbi:MAG: RnfABCDGE type electron transport complex subunit D [Alistipes sp.]|nr:RnfABCDGE type electron transport complex subunit D [Alistipes sp.]MBR2399780.1 RnfABCDGE type electron transport complex subunit D [Alistipes sp.]